MGARQSAGSTSGTVYRPPTEEGDAVSRVWALSPPGTTDWAAFGRRVSGAWSVARSPPPRPARHPCRSCPREDPQTPAPPLAAPRERTWGVVQRGGYRDGRKANPSNWYETRG